MYRYRTLDPDRIVETIARLERRIAERFPTSGLRKVCNELLDVARETKLRTADAARANVGLRIGIAFVLALGLGGLYTVASIIEVKRDAESLFGVLQGIDAAVSILVFTGAAALSLSTIEGRMKRHRALAHLGELRSLVHVIDMHQLTKDPSAAAMIATGTPSSPQRQLSVFELARYLDYCSEMLSLVAKVAALHAQSTKDPVVIEAESDLVQITSNMSNKIWQKITIVQGQFGLMLPAPAPAPAVAVAAASASAEGPSAGLSSPVPPNDLAPKIS